MREESCDIKTHTCRTSLSIPPHLRVASNKLYFVTICDLRNEFPCVLYVLNIYMSSYVIEYFYFADEIALTVF